MAAVVCPKCGRLTEGNAPTCYHCGARLGRAWALERAAGRFLGEVNLTKSLLGFILLVYVVQMILSLLQKTPSQLERGGFFSLLSPDPAVQWALGIQDPAMILRGGEWWRVVTAVFVHLGILHLFFNGLALWYVGPLVENLFGPARAFLLFLGTGLAGNLASLPVGIGGGGASGALFGWIGAALYFGFRRGGIYGKALQRTMFGWAAYGFLFGLLVPRVNNVAHGAGFLSGLLLAALLGGEGRRWSRGVNLLALAGGVLVLACWILAFLYFKKDYGLVSGG